MIRPLRAWFTALAGGLAMLSAGALRAADQVPESEDPIIVAINEWTGQHITAYITARVLEKMGYNVEYTTAAVFPMATAMADGNITLGLEYWDNNMGEWLPKLMAEGKVEDLGTLGLDAREGWVYPKHVEELCPGLPDWGRVHRLLRRVLDRRDLPGRTFRRVPGRMGYPLHRAHHVGGPALPGDPRRQRGARWWRSSRPR